MTDAQPTPNNIECYLCDKSIDDSNRSSEHIILNAIGGRLKSDKLLCKSCNNALGSKADAELADQFSFLTAFLDVKRERGNTPVVKGGKTKDGTEYHLVGGSKIALARPEFNTEVAEEGIRYTITARSMDEMKKMIAGLKKKHPALDVDEVMNHGKVLKERLTEPVNFSQPFGGSEAFQAIIKMAVNFYIYHKGEKKYVSHLFEMIKGNQPATVVKHYYPPKRPYKRQANEIIHLLHLYGNPHTGVLYCYVELFSIHSFLVILSTDYEGEQLNKTYSYDLVTRTVLEKTVTLRFDKEELSGMPTRFSAFDAVKINADRVMQIGSKIRSDKEISAIVGSAVKEIFVDKYPDGAPITPEMVDEFVTLTVGRYVEHFLG